MGSVEGGTDRDASLRPVLVLAGAALVLYALDQLTKALVVANEDVGFVELLAAGTPAEHKEL